MKNKNRAGDEDMSTDALHSKGQRRVCPEKNIRNTNPIIVEKHAKENLDSLRRGLCLLEEKVQNDKSQIPVVEFLIAPFIWLFYIKP
jgi:hypothetical protein